MRAARSALAALMLLATLVSQPARAALFEDDEARKAILDLRARLSQLEESRRKDAEQQQELVGPLRRGVLDLNAQIESLRGELARLRGQNEQLARELAETQRRLADQSQSVETRLRPLEPQKVVLDGKEFQAAPEEKAQYEAAMAAVRKGDFNEAADQLAAFQKRYPSSGYADSARFWLGNAQYGKRDYKEAIASFKAFVAGHPAHPRAPEALLAQANCQIELKDSKGARRTLDDLLKAYPASEAAQAAKERLVSMKK